MRMRKQSNLCVAALATSLVFAGASASSAEVVRVNYTASAATVVDMPFGLDIPRLTVVSGYFEFDTSTPDENMPDETEGLYRHMSAGAFVASFLTNEITGSSESVYEFDTGFQSVRITDGPGTFGDEGGLMSLDGQADEDIELFVGFGPEFTLVDDSFVNPFDQFDLSFIGTPHTFRLSDDNGTMLLQFDTLEIVGDTTTSSTTLTTSSTTTTTMGTPKVCGDPVDPTPPGVGSAPSAVTASDALFVLNAAVGAASCELCVCDVNDSGATTASDALALLQAAVGQSIQLICPSCSPGLAR